MQEIWKDIKGYENLYQISNSGNVKSFKKYKQGKILKEMRIGGGSGVYSAVKLYYKNRGKNHYIHILVAQHFLDNPENLPEVDHRDTNPNNNKVNNLRWISRKGNFWSVKKQIIATNLETKEKIIFDSLKSAAEFTKTTSGGINLVVTKKIKHSKGWYFEYVDASKKRYNRKNATI